MPAGGSERLENRAWLCHLCKRSKATTDEDEDERKLFHIPGNFVSKIIQALKTKPVRYD